MLQKNQIEDEIISYSMFPLAGPGKTDRAKTKSVNAVKAVSSFKEFLDNTYTTSFSCSTFRNNYRSKENFLAASVIPLDFDSGVKDEQVIDRLKQLNLNYGLVYSQSHSESKHKFHVFLPLDEPIIDPRVYECTYKDLLTLFPEADVSIGNPDRFFFSSKEGTSKVFELSNRSLTPKTALNSSTLLVKKTAPAHDFGPGYHYYIENINKAQGNEWNNCLNAAVKDMAKRGHLEPEIIWALQEGYNAEEFNSATLREIKRNFTKGRMLYLKDQDKPEKEAKISFSDMYQSVAEELDVNNLVLLKGLERARILKNHGKGEVHEISLSVIQSEVGSIVNEIYAKTIPASMCKNLADTWFSQTEATCTQPSHVKFASDQGITQKKLDFDPDQSKSCPVWSEMMGRTTNSDALQAFIYAIFVPQSYRQQYLWIYGDGGNGKSTITDLLSKLLGASYVVSDTNSGHNSQFFTYSLDGKRLLVFPDTNSETFVQTGVFKQLTGEGLIRMEGKGKDAYSAPIDVKIIINSNNFPTLSSKKADIRRIIFCEMASLTVDPNPRVMDLLWNERAAILGACQKAYSALTTLDGPIKFECAKIEDLANASDEVFEMIFEELLTVSTEEIISGPELRRIVSPRVKNAGVKRYEYFLNWLTEKAKLAKYGTYWKNGKAVRGFRGVKLL